MKKLLSPLLFTLLLNFSTLAQALIPETKCFIMKENSEVIAQEGSCESQHAPCSTFKIALSLMGYNEGFLINEVRPELPFKEGYVEHLDVWKQPHTPATWMENTCLWYSHLIVDDMGTEKLTQYLSEFDYGNQDISGDKGKNNGPQNSWISSSLEISPEEQSLFLEKLLNDELPVTSEAQEMTRNILFVENLPNEWKLYGKTGRGSQLTEDRTQKLLDRQIGWYVGWIEKDERAIVFVHYIEDQDKQDTQASFRARDAAKEKLISFIQEMA